MKYYPNTFNFSYLLKVSCEFGRHMAWVHRRDDIRPSSVCLNFCLRKLQHQQSPLERKTKARVYNTRYAVFVSRLYEGGVETPKPSQTNTYDSSLEKTHGQLFSSLVVEQNFY